MSEELLPYTVLKPISFKGDRIEKGSVIRMTPEEAENIGDEFLEPAEEADEQETSTADESTDETDTDESKDSDGDSDDDEGTETKEDENSSEENAEDTQTGNQPDETI